jgi:thiamine-phosphate pyrophosphorylase
MKIKSHLITDPALFGSQAQEFVQKLQQSIDVYHPDFICLRDKQTEDYEELAQHFLRLSGDFHALLHSDVDLAIKYKAYGVHLRSDQFNEIQKAKEAGLFVVASTHSHGEALAAKEADAITYSPIFFSPGKGNPKGLEELKEIAGKIGTKIFALGGIINAKQVHEVEECGVYGFASIRYFDTHKEIDV